MFSIDKPITDPNIDAEQSVKQERQKDQAYQDSSPEILVAEADADLAERIRAVEQDETSDRALKDPTVAEYHRLAQQFREDLQKAGVLEADIKKKQQLLETYGGEQGYSKAVSEDSQKRQAELEAREKAEAERIAKERQASLERTAEVARRIQEEDPEKQREHFGKEIMEKVVEATDEENEEQYLPPEDDVLFESRHVDAILEKVPPPEKADSEDMEDMYKSLQDLMKKYPEES